MANINENNVLLTKNIVWDEKNIYKGLSAIKKAQFTELDNVLNILDIGLQKHQEDANRNQHGIVTLKRSGYLSKELVGKLESITNLLTYYKTQAPTSLVPSGIIVMYDKPATSIKSGWKWCNGEDIEPDTRARCFMGGSTSSTFPIGKDTITTTSGTESLNLKYASATIQKKV